MTQVAFEELIHKYFPEVTWDEFVFVTDGWDCDVAILDDTTVFRAPRVFDERQLLLEEVALLEVLHDSGIAHIPRYMYLAQDGAIGGYTKLSGVHPTSEYVNGLPEKEQVAFGNALGTFLKKLHAIPVEKVASMVSPCDYAADVELLQSDVALMEQHFPSAEYFAKTQEILENIIHVLRQDPVQALVHKDLNPGNLLWNSTDQTLSIFDFTDKAIVHPVVDMAYIAGYTLTVQQAAYAAYAIPSEEWKGLANNLYKSIGVRVLRAAAKGSKNVTLEEAQAGFMQKFSI